MISFEELAKRITRKWKQDKKLPYRAFNYTFDFVEHIPGLGFYVTSQFDNRPLHINEIFGGITTEDIISEVWSTFSEEEKIEFMAKTLGTYND